MFYWLKKLFRGVGFTPPMPELKPEPKEPDTRTIKALPDIIARPKGQKRNKFHVYRQPFGYPIRLCDWVWEDPDDLIPVVKPEGESLKKFIDDSRLVESGRMCLHCWRVLLGDRTSVGMDNHGHGKGAPLP